MSSSIYLRTVINVVFILFYSTNVIRDLLLQRINRSVNVQNFSAGNLGIHQINLHPIMQSYVRNLQASLNKNAHIRYRNSNQVVQNQQFIQKSFDLSSGHLFKNVSSAEFCCQRAQGGGRGVDLYPYLSPRHATLGPPCPQV